jgi:hypothetical protein
VPQNPSRFKHVHATHPRACSRLEPQLVLLRRFRKCMSFVLRDQVPQLCTALVIKYVVPILIRALRTARCLMDARQHSLARARVRARLASPSKTPRNTKR